MAATREFMASTPVPAEPLAAAASDDRDSGFTAKLKNAKVLVVDDSVANQSLVSRLLSSWGLRPGAVADGDSAQAVFNGESLLARLMGDQGLAGNLPALFLEDAPQRLLALKDRLEAGDACGARLLAHALKGAAATVSAEALRTVCSEVQEAAASGNILRASAMLPRLLEQFELFRATLNESGWAESNSQSSL